MNSYFSLAAILLSAALWTGSLVGLPSHLTGHSERDITRPAIVGVSHFALRTDNIAAAREFYGRVLGFQEPFSLNKAPADGGGLMLTYFKVNDHQYIEVFPELTDAKMDRLSHISF